MIWLSPRDCGLSDWACTALSEDGGLKLSRVSEYWKKRLPHCVTSLADTSAGITLRFMTDASQVALRFFDGVPPMQMRPFSVFVDGVFHTYDFCLDDGYKRLTVALEGAENKRVEIFLPRNGEMTLYALGIDDGACLTPIADTRKTVCFYGDSITHGDNASEPANAYPAVLSRMLDVRAVNHGYSGSAFPDPATAAFLSRDVRWDVLTVAIGTNTFGQAYESAAEFERMYRLFLEIVRLNRPDAPIVYLTPLWRGNADGDGKTNARGNTLEDYRNAVRNAAASLADGNITLVEGQTLISGPEGLMPDRLHPDDRGMRMMADGLAPVLGAALNTAGR